MWKTLGGWLAVSLLAAPSVAWATTCDTRGVGEVNCEGDGRLTSVNLTQANELQNYTCGGDAETGPERILLFTCETSNFAKIRMFNTACDIDFFVLGDECLPSDTCIASHTGPYNANPNSYDDTFFCEAGRQYFIVVEGWALTQLDFLLQISGTPVCPDLCVGGTQPGCVGGTVVRGSNFSMVAECGEVCDDGHDNDRDLAFDCDDSDCASDPACSVQVEDCDNVGDEDGNGDADCDDDACAMTEVCCDVDGDQVFANGAYCGDGGDCDDDDPDAYPGAPEVAADGIDQDCDGGDDCFIDADEDGFGAGQGGSPDMACDAPFEAIVGGDCDDTNGLVNPDAPEVPANGTDDDCVGGELCYVDGDRDTYGSMTTVASMNLLCNSLGLSNRNDDCNDMAIGVHPDAPEIVGNSVDEDCDSKDACYVDADGDTFGSTQVVPSFTATCLTMHFEATNALDCLDSDGSVNPNGTEVPYDGLDNDCVGGDLTDQDADGFHGGPGGPDCDDLDPDIKPGVADPVADGVDQDCDGADDCYEDLDGDGVGTGQVVQGTTLDCSAEGESARDDDCDDTRDSVFPGATEVPYDGIDQDCALGDLDDIDGDGFKGGPSGTDCVDRVASIHPGATEVPDGVDQDCDGVVDDGTIWGDDDGDGYAEAGGDCNDALAAVHPGAIELLNNRDDDCDGVVDDNTRAYDDDGDGFTENQGDCHDGNAAIYPGAPESNTAGIDQNCDGVLQGGDNDQDGYAVFGGDCNDADPDVFPGAQEGPNGVDDDCDGTIDEGTRNVDDDRDGVTENDGDCDDTNDDRSPNAPEILGNHLDDDCDGLVDEGGRGYDDDGDGFSELDGDCNDADAAVMPYAPELANGVDDNCNGAIDEGLHDQDRDGYTVEQGDCDDRDGWANPGADEACDGIDNDCDGAVDEGCIDREPEDTGDGAPASGGCDQSGGTPWGVLGLAGLLGLRRRRV